MRVLVVGATGALGRPLVPLLAARGHEVDAASRNSSGSPAYGSPASGTSGSPASGAVTPVALDLLDRRAVLTVLRQHQPDAVVHFATAIPHAIDPKKIGRQFATTNRLRTVGTRNLLDAAAEAGVGRFIAEGLAYAYEPGDAIRDETDPIWPTPPKVYAPVARALADMESMVGGAGGTVLRLGHLYGPGTVYAPDGSVTAMVRKGRMPIVGEGAARFSFVHVDDVASAVLAALDHPGGGTFNVVDDTPLRVREWLPWFAEQLGAKPPRRIPVALARLVVGPFGVTFLNGLAGASNARAREVLRWRPHFPDFRDGVVATSGGRLPRAL